MTAAEITLGAVVCALWAVLLILSAIGIIELTQTGTLIIARNLQGFKVWLMIAVLYLIVITLLTWLSNWVEKRIN